VVDSALNRTRTRTAALVGVDIRHAALPGDWPDKRADLIVLAEVGYYLDAGDLDYAVREAARRLTAGGVLVAVHWRHGAPDYPLTGDEVHHLIDALPQPSQCALTPRESNTEWVDVKCEV
jgi:hypothetical protein